MANTPLFAPDADAIEALARVVIARLPVVFRDHLEDVVLRVEEFADQETLDELEVEDPFALSGLYSGRPLTEKSSMDSGTLPDMIHLYRRALIDEWADTGLSLEALIAHVVIHEIGHHLGYSDAEMAAIESAVE